MATVFTPADAAPLGLVGRASKEIVSGARGAANASLRIVDIAPAKAGDPPRKPHVHTSFEEVIYVLTGEGVTETKGRAQPVRAGDTILIPQGEPHVTHNTGSGTLQLLCFFPTPDVAAGTRDLDGF
jgi:mannose-6-phosphate isomerase-like protein (cupin superfamily)